MRRRSGVASARELSRASLRTPDVEAAAKVPVDMAAVDARAVEPHAGVATALGAGELRALLVLPPLPCVCNTRGRGSLEAARRGRAGAFGRGADLGPGVLPEDDSAANAALRRLHSPWEAVSMDCNFASRVEVVGARLVGRGGG